MVSLYVVIRVGGMEGWRDGWREGWVVERVKYAKMRTSVRKTSCE